jgi:endoglucanase
MATPDLLMRLLAASGPSGYETDPARVWREGCSVFSKSVETDDFGSSRALVPGTAGGPTLAIVGHIDEIGVHITHIEDGGHLRFGQVGGWDALVLVGQRIRLLTREGPVVGVIARKPIHLLKDDDRKQAPQIKDLHIDIGAEDADDARSMVRIGDVGVVDVEPLEFPNGRVISRALDNRVGCFVAAEAGRLVAEAGGAPGDVIPMAVAQEEIGLNGARTSAFALKPDLAIVTEVTFATDQPGIELGQTTKHTLGSGPVLSRGMTLHPKVFELLHAAGEDAGIPFTIESLGRATGTDADVIHVSRSGIPTGLVSVPLRYMHSPVEMISLDDIEAAARLIAAFAQRLEPGMSFAR